MRISFRALTRSFYLSLSMRTCNRGGVNLFDGIGEPVCLPEAFVDGPKRALSELNIDYEIA